MESILDVLVLPALGAPLFAGLYGVLIGGSFSRSVVVTVYFFAVFFLAYIWVSFAIISIQGWGHGNLDFYWYWMRTIFVPTLIAGTLGSGILAYSRRKGQGAGWGDSVLVVLAGMGAFGVGALLCARIAAEILARTPSSSREAVDLAIAVGFYGPLLIGPLPLGLALVSYEWLRHRTSG